MCHISKKKTIKNIKYKNFIDYFIITFEYLCKI